MPPVWCACLKFKPQGLCLAPQTVEAALAVALFTGILPGIDVRLVSLGRASADTALLRSRRGADHYVTGQWTGALQIGPYRCMLRDVSLSRVWLRPCEGGASERSKDIYSKKRAVEYRRACLTAGGYPASSSEQTASAWPDQDCAHSPCVNRQIARDRSGMLFRVAVECMVPAPATAHCRMRF